MSLPGCQHLLGAAVAGGVQFLHQLGVGMYPAVEAVDGTFVGEAWRVHECQLFFGNGEKHGKVKS